MRVNYFDKIRHREVFTNSHDLVNTTAPPVVLEIQKVHGNQEVLQFLIDEYDSTMEAFIEIRSSDPNLIWSYQRIVSEDLIASVCLSDATNPKYVIACFRYYVFINREGGRKVGKIDRDAIGTL